MFSTASTVTLAVLGAAVVSTSTSTSAFVATGAQATTEATTAHLKDAHVKVHFNLASGQIPENIVPDRNGSVDVTFAVSRQVARITTDGRTHILATFPATPGAAAPVLGFPALTGLVRHGDTVEASASQGILVAVVGASVLTTLGGLQARPRRLVTDASA